ncbi:uncharacterized protein LOC112003668 [Quercus suber]|uniref:uncharacterized protein LOC112003668 n=1 Tax=Quercus suber TaxID=58331 RepID=UPI0032E0150D
MDPEVFQAASSGNSSFFENLSESKCNTLQQATTIEKNTVLHVALRFKNFEAAKSIVNSIPGLMYKTNSKDNTPLHVAARVGKPSMVKLLIDHDKKPDVESGGRKQLLNMVNQDGDTALHVALRYDKDGQFEIVKELIKEDPRLAERVNNAGESALFLAVDRELYDMASHILSAAPDNCSNAGRHGMNVLHALVIRTSRFTLRELRNYGQASGCNRFAIGFFWVFKMVFGDYPITNILSRELQKFGYRKALALFLGNIRTIPGIVEAVINKWPCTIEQVDDSGWTPLHIAAHLGNDKIIKLILEKEKSIAYAKNKEGLSALHIAAMEGNLAVMKELITACPDIYEMLDNRGQTAIHAATERGQLLPFLLFRMKPEFKGLLTLVSEQNEEGNTPFYLAAIKGHALSFRCMECAECDNFNATNKEGFTTMDKLFLGRLPFGEAWKERHIKPLWKKGARPSLKQCLVDITKVGMWMIKSKRNIEKCLQLELRIWSDIDMHSNIVVFIRVLTSLASAFPTASTHTRHVSTNVKEEIELNASNCVPHQCSHKEE